MPRYEKDGRVIETSLTREGAHLRAEGWTESKARTKAVKEADAQREENVVVDALPDGGAPATSDVAPEAKAQRSASKRN